MQGTLLLYGSLVFAPADLLICFGRAHKACSANRINIFVLVRPLFRSSLQVWGSSVAPLLSPVRLLRIFVLHCETALTLAPTNLFLCHTWATLWTTNGRRKHSIPSSSLSCFDSASRTTHSYKRQKKAGSFCPHQLPRELYVSSDRACRVWFPSSPPHHHHHHQRPESRAYSTTL